MMIGLTTLQNKRNAFLLAFLLFLLPSIAAPGNSQGSSDAPPAVLMMLSVLMLVFLFFISLFMLSKAISSPFLEQTAKAGLLDTLLVSFVVAVVVPIIQDGSMVNFAATFIENFLPSGASCPSTSGACDINSWFDGLMEPISTSTSSLISTIDRNLAYISSNSGVISMSFQGQGLSFSEFIKEKFGVDLGGKDSGSEGSEGDAEAGAISAPSPTPSTRIGFGGHYAFFTNMLFMLRAHATSLMTLISFIITLKEIALNTNLLLQMFFVGALLRAFNFSKGAGAFLMAFALSLNVVFVPSLVWGMSIATSSNFGVSPSDFEGGIEDISFTSNDDSLLKQSFKLLKKLSFDIVETPAPFQGDKAKEIAERIFDTNIFDALFAIVLYTLVLSFSLLLVVSASGGLSKLLGADVSIWIIGQLAQMV